MITGADSGIGRVVALAFARESADVAITYLSEHEDAKETQALVLASEESSYVCGAILAGTGGEPLS